MKPTDLSKEQLEIKELRETLAKAQHKIELVRTHGKDIAKARKKEIKLRISNPEDLQDVLDMVMGVRMTPGSEDVRLSYNDNQNWMSLLIIPDEKRPFKVYSNVSEYKLQGYFGK